MTVVNTNEPRPEDSNTELAQRQQAVREAIERTTFLFEHLSFREVTKDTYQSTFNSVQEKGLRVCEWMGQLRDSGYPFDATLADNFDRALHKCMNGLMARVRVLRASE